MTTAELHAGKLAAAECLAKCRERGGIVLRLWRENGWYLHMLNGHAVPSELKFQLLDLQPFVFVLLRELGK